MRTHQEPTRDQPGINQNHLKIDQETSSLLRLFFTARGLLWIRLHQP